VNRGIGYFEQAIEKDPTYALAYSGLADCYRARGGLFLVPPKETYPKAKEAALKALEIDDTLGEAHASLGSIKSSYDWDWSGAEKEFQRAIELNPSDAAAHRAHGVSLVRTGRLEETIREEKRALELDPLSLNANRSLRAAFYFARQYERAIEQERKTLELGSNFRLARDDLGLAEMEDAVALSPGDPPTLVDLGYAYAVAGRRAEAQKVLDQLNELSKQKYISGYFVARIYAALGDQDKAFAWLEKAYEDRSMASGFGTIKTDPAYDPLRSDPRFQDLLRRMNLQP
jgi:tetratricopeptide (TPR) repeat protein